MNKAFLAGSLLLFFAAGFGQQKTSYHSLDAKHPIAFHGNFIVYKGDTIHLGSKAFFIDGQLSDEQASKQPFVFNSINAAASHLVNGTEQNPMVLYIAPYVYWIDDPNDPAVRIGKNGAPPYGLVIECEWLKFHGLSEDPANVVLASNRGQTIGAQGNFTMFKFVGQGTGSENITFGNYCNIDLVYPLKPALSRAKRASAIVQAQLIHCNGDKIIARNTRFVSRLNLCPFVGGKRVLFDRCHFESTDDALCGTGVYLDCSLDFYGSKPFYQTTGTGAVFLNCDIHSYTSKEQFFTKANGQVAVVDTRIITGQGTYVGWRDVLPKETRNYQYHVLQNSQPVLISKKDDSSTIDMSGKPVLNAYRFLLNGKVVYNTYNLLQGNDDWDPMQVKSLVEQRATASGDKYSMLPVQLLVGPTKVTIETGKSDVTLTARLMRFGNYEATAEKISWSVNPGLRNLVQLHVSQDGRSCRVVPLNNNDDVREVVVTATSPSGLQGASMLLVAPPKVAPPDITSAPGIHAKDGRLEVMYKLDGTYKDQSIITWYRCTDPSGKDPIEVAVSRFNIPMKEYVLSTADIGYYMMVKILPKSTRSDPGEPSKSVMKEPVSQQMVKARNTSLFTDFKNLSLRNQPRVLPGFWTWDHLEIKDNDPRNIVNKENDAWYYGEGSEGAANLQGLLQGRSAIMRYTPVGNQFGNMKLTLHVAPFKAAGQGFSVAHLYMDVLVKFDAKTNTGYGLRLIRTTRYHDAVDCILVEYKNGEVHNLSDPVTTTAFKTLCTITVETGNDNITAHLHTSAERPGAERPNVFNEVKMEAKINPNFSGGFGIQFNGGSPCIIKDLKADWK